MQQGPLTATKVFTFGVPLCCAAPNQWLAARDMQWRPLQRLTGVIFPPSCPQTSCSLKNYMKNKAVLSRQHLTETFREAMRESDIVPFHLDTVANATGLLQPFLVDWTGIKYPQVQYSTDILPLYIYWCPRLFLSFDRKSACGVRRAVMLAVVLFAMFALNSSSDFSVRTHNQEQTVPSVFVCVQ